jgi:hypothetical protein
MKIQIAIIFVIIFTTVEVKSQSQYKNGVFIELGGNGYLYSINYERQLPRKFIARGGISYALKSFVIPITIEQTYGQKNHHLNVGVGPIFSNYYQTNNDVPTRRNALAITYILGYRYQKPDKKFFLKVSFTPIQLIYNNDPLDKTPDPIRPWGGIAVGTRF